MTKELNTLAKMYAEMRGNCEFIRVWSTGEASYSVEGGSFNINLNSLDICFEILEWRCRDKGYDYDISFEALVEGKNYKEHECDITKGTDKAFFGCGNTLQEAIASALHQMKEG